MDTRTKIVSVSDAPRGRVVVVGYFDPMLPAHVAQLREQAGCGRLVVLLATAADAYLEARARAELAASLEFVEVVVVAEGDVEAAIAALAPSERLHMEAEELARRAEFLAYVRERARQS